MNLPKFNSADGRCYWMKPEVQEELQPLFDQCIQDAIDGKITRLDDSHWPPVVVSSQGAPFEVWQLLRAWTEIQRAETLDAEKAIAFSENLRRQSRWGEIDHHLLDMLKRELQEKYFVVTGDEDDRFWDREYSLKPGIRAEEVPEPLLRFACYVAVSYKVYGLDFQYLDANYLFGLVEKVRPDMVKKLREHGTGRLPLSLQKRKTEHFTASANDAFAAIRITARDNTEECCREVLNYLCELLEQEDFPRSYSNVPPMMAAIKSGDIEAIRSLLHAGHSPNEPQCYHVMIGDWPRDDEASPLELAVLENRMDMVQLLIECGADLTHNPEELLCGSLRSQDLTLFSFLVDVGVRIPATQRDICRLFLHLVDRDEPNVLPILKRMGMDLKQYGGEALRSMASHGNQLLVEYLIQNGADINYHKPDMVFPYASTPVTEAARHNDFSMVRWLVEQGADITIPDKYGDRPYTVAVQNKNQEMAAYLKALEPEEWHNEQEKARQLMPYKLPAKLVEYLKTGPLRLEFPERELVKWAELYPYMDVQEMTWKRKKLLSLMAKMDNYSDYLLLWSPRDKKLWYLDIEHKEFHPLAKWEEFIADPGKYLNGMIEGEFEE